MTLPIRFPYRPVVGATGTGLMPVAPVELRIGVRSLATTGLLDSGSAVNVLPWRHGLSLGADWQLLIRPLPLGGAFGPVPAKALPVTAVVAGFPAVTLVFAWAQSDRVPLLFGQMNFFLEFDVCFFGARAEFEIQPKHP